MILTILTISMLPFHAHFNYPFHNLLTLLKYLLSDEDKKMWDHDGCQEFSKHVLHPHMLPKECQKFRDVVSNLKRRETDTTPSTSILS